MAIVTDNEKKNIYTYIYQHIEKFILITHTSSSSLSFLFYDIVTHHHNHNHHNYHIIIIIYHYLSSSSSSIKIIYHHLSPSSIASLSLSPSSTIIIVIITIIYHRPSLSFFQMLPQSEGQGLPHSLIVPVRYSQVHSHMLYGEASNRPIRNSTQRNR